MNWAKRATEPTWCRATSVIHTLPWPSTDRPYGTNNLQPVSQSRRELEKNYERHWTHFKVVHRPSDGLL